MVGKTKIQQSSLAPSQLTSLKCNPWTSDIANMTAESLVKIAEELRKENGER